MIATIGPACDSIELLTAMIEAGMNVARLNMSHGDETSHAETVARIRAAADACGATVAIMVDTRGREIRSGKVVDDQVLLNADQPFTLYAEERLGDESGVSISLQSLDRHAKPGHRVLVDDGQIELCVESVEAGKVHCRIETGGVLRNNKGVNLPDTPASLDDIHNDMGVARAQGEHRQRIDARIHAGNDRHAPPWDPIALVGQAGPGAADEIVARCHVVIPDSADCAVSVPPYREK